MAAASFEGVCVDAESESGVVGWWCEWLHKKQISFKISGCKGLFLTTTVSASLKYSHGKTQFRGGSDVTVAWALISLYGLRSRCKNIRFVSDFFHVICAVHIVIKETDLRDFWAKKLELSHFCPQSEHSHRGQQSQISYVYIFLASKADFVFHWDLRECFTAALLNHSRGDLFTCGL